MKIHRRDKITVLLLLLGVDNTISTNQRRATSSGCEWISSTWPSGLDKLTIFILFMWVLSSLQWWIDS